MNNQEALQQYIQHLKFEKRYALNTYVSYENDISQFIEFVAAKFEITTLQQITLHHLRSWIMELNVSGQHPKSLQRKGSALRSWFKYHMRLGHLHLNPAQILQTPKLPKRLPSYLEMATINEVDFNKEEQVSEIKQTTDHLIFELLFQTGMRRSELCQLKHKHVEWDRKQLIVQGKRNKERIVPISENLIEHLKTYLLLKNQLFITTFDDLLLVTERGKPIYPQYVYRVVKKQLNHSTLTNKGPHILRHSFATHLSNNGAEINAVKDLLGHASLSSTQIYTHTNIEKLKEEYRKSHPKS